MPADTSVKLIHSAMAGAPTLSNVAGNLISVLNAALVDGFGTNTVDSLVISGGVATVTRAAGHPFDVGSVASISGATTTTGSVNGEQRVLAVTATSYTFEAAGIGNQTATGTISHKVAALGWGRPFAGSSTLQVYRSADVSSTRDYLRVDDTGTTDARVVGYETMSSESAGTGPFPTAAAVSGGLFWPKCTAGLTNRPWMIVGDGRLFYLWVQYRNDGTGQQFIVSFGDFESKKSPDPYACLLVGSSVALTTTIGSLSACWSYTNQAANFGYAPRGVAGLGDSVPLARVAMTPHGYQSQYSGANGTGQFLFPNPADNAVYLSPYLLLETTPQVALRGTAPGAFYFPHSVGSTTFSLRDRIVGVTGYAGRSFAAFPVPVGVMFFDTTGPWR